MHFLQKTHMSFELFSHMGLGWDIQRNEEYTTKRLLRSANNDSLTEIITKPRRLRLKRTSRCFFKLDIVLWAAFKVFGNGMQSLHFTVTVFSVLLTNSKNDLRYQVSNAFLLLLSRSELAMFTRKQNRKWVSMHMYELGYVSNNK